MTENNRNPERTDASELFHRASQLPTSNFEARTLAQICESEESDR